MFNIPMNRTTFLVDGFNVYHSLLAASMDLGGKPTKWLDLRSLLSSFLPVIGAGAELEEIYYFTALATHLDPHRPGVTARHRLYMEALVATGVIPVLGRFKYKTVHCCGCKIIGDCLNLGVRHFPVSLLHLRQYRSGQRHLVPAAEPR